MVWLQRRRTFARWMVCLVGGLGRAMTGSTSSSTSKHMFSPSRSQSSHRTRSSQPRPSCRKASQMCSLGLASFFSVAARNNSVGRVASLWWRVGRCQAGSKRCGSNQATLRPMSPIAAYISNLPETWSDFEAWKWGCPMGGTAHSKSATSTNILHRTSCCTAPGSQWT